MRPLALLVVFFALADFYVAQLPYAQPLFVYDSLMNVEYGTALNYAGNTDTLRMDIYKPKGDSNCNRPIIVLVHGGAWIGGSKQDVDLVRMARDFARRGWVVANINYRLGTHKAANYTMYALCNNTISQPCAYITDSAEIFRANFRGMQDTKGAIRFMKNRHFVDSTDVNNVFLCGESAGGFIVLATAFIDQPAEKPASCFAISNAPNPSAALNPYACNPSQISYLRPDLGSIDGTLHLGNYDAAVKGVGNIFGGLFDFTSLPQTSGNLPCVYLYHQGSDVVVHYQYGRILGRTSWECYAQTNVCQTYYFYPFAYGGEGIRQQFVSMGTSAPVYTADIMNNYNYMNDCFANGHSIDNFNLRFQSMVDLFAGRIQQSGNVPSAFCNNVNGTSSQFMPDEIQLFPNPVQNKVSIRVSTASSYIVQDAMGKIVSKGVFQPGENNISLDQLASGIYFLRVIAPKVFSSSFIKE